MEHTTPSHNLVVNVSPHIHSGASVPTIMLDVLIALIPATTMALFFFGWDAARLIGACLLTCLLIEWACRKLMKRDNTLLDFSAMVTGLLLALNLPPALPTWMAVVGSIFAIAIVKQVFGGLGYNVFNPALAARAFMLISFTGAMTTWSASGWAGLDAVTTATPLGFAKEAIKSGEAIPFTFSSQMLNTFLFGNVNGCIGETSALALLIGGAYLMLKRVITWHIPAAYLGSVALVAAVLQVCSPATALPVAFHLLSGGLFLGAFFMATDMVTSPLTHKGMIVFGLGCGVLTMIIRVVPSGAYPEGASFAILIMNAFTPLINRATRNRTYGTVKR